jgi:hypothetical protein
MYLDYILDQIHKSFNEPNKNSLFIFEIRVIKVEPTTAEADLQSSRKPRRR